MQSTSSTSFISSFAVRLGAPTPQPPGSKHSHLFSRRPACPQPVSRATATRLVTKSVVWPWSKGSSLPDPADAARRQRDLEKVRSQYQYAQAKQVTTATVVKDLPKSERPALLWIFKVAATVLKVRIRLIRAESNLRLVAGEASPGNTGIVGAFARAYAFVDTLFSTLFGNVEGLGGNERLRKLRARVVEAGKPAADSVLNVVDGSATFPGGVAEFVGGMNESVEVQATMDYRAVIGYEKLSDEESAYMEIFDSDKTFARLRVAGLNPMKLRAVTDAELDSPEWMLTDAHLREAGASVAGGGGFATDTLATAARDGRLFMVSYEWLDKLPKSVGKERFVFVPTAVFCVPPDAKARVDAPLVPVGIWIRPTKESKGIAGSEVENSETKLYVPSQRLAWEVAKLIVTVADGNDHEYFRHLGLTHLLMEPFGIAFKRNLHEDHPLYSLLLPHFKGTSFINNRAISDLINPGGPVDKVLIADIETAGPVVSEIFAEVKFNDLFLRTEMEARGVLDADVLDYPYRDYALSLWDSVHSWVTAVVRDYYADDRDVVADGELQSFAKEMNDVVGLKGFGDKAFVGGDVSAPIIASRAYLSNVLTMIIFTASCQHAALNFPQKPFLSFIPAWPLSIRQGTLPKPSPSELDAKTVVSEWRAWFPPMLDQETQFSLNQLLGAIYYTRLGEGYSSRLSKGRSSVADALQEFQKSLREVEIEIENREAGQRLPYHFLKPSQIPASINI